MNRQQLTNRVHELTSQFLGFQTQMAGLQHTDKATLERMVINLEKAVELKAEVRRLEQKHGREVFGAAAIFPGSVSTDVSADFNRAAELHRQANELWYNLKA
jgi:hypothetical protein